MYDVELEDVATRAVAFDSVASSFTMAIHSVAKQTCAINQYLKGTGASSLNLLRSVGGNGFPTFC